MTQQTVRKLTKSYQGELLFGTVVDDVRLLKSHPLSLSTCVMLYYRSVVIVSLVSGSVKHFLQW